MKAVREKERKRVIEMGIQPSMSVNGFLGSLPRIEKKKVWKVMDNNGAVVQYVGSTDNRISTAQKYIDNKYPGRVLTLSFSHYNGFLPPL